MDRSSTQSHPTPPKPHTKPPHPTPTSPKPTPRNATQRNATQRYITVHSSNSTPNSCYTARLTFSSNAFPCPRWIPLPSGSYSALTKNPEISALEEERLFSNMDVTHKGFVDYNEVGGGRVQGRLQIGTAWSGSVFIATLMKGHSYAAGVAHGCRVSSAPYAVPD